MHSPDGRLNSPHFTAAGLKLCATWKFNEINSALHTLNSPYRATAIYERGGVRSRSLSLSLSSPVSLSPSWFSMRTDFLENNEFPSFLMACANVVSAPSPFHPVPSLTSWLNSSFPRIPCHFNWFDLPPSLSSDSVEFHDYCIYGFIYEHGVMIFRCVRYV